MTGSSPQGLDMLVRLAGERLGGDWNPFADDNLAAYLGRVRDWHGYVRFLGLPHLGDNPDVGIDQLFVEPALSPSPLAAEAANEDLAQAPEALAVLDKERRLIVLGDPGSGKSTLVNWLAWSLAVPRATPAREKLGSLLPVPMVVREMDIRAGIDGDGLIAAFLGQLVARGLEREKLESTLQEGRALLLVDGLDEIASVEVRRALRKALFQLVDRYPACRWLLTSRIVGYDQIPFDRRGDILEEGVDARLKAGHDEGVLKRHGRARPGHPGQSGEAGIALPPHPDPPLEGEGASSLPLSGGGGGGIRPTSAFHSIALPGHPRLATEGEGIAFALRYAAPFDDARIDRFARHWYAQREAAPEAAAAKARALVDAIHAHDSVERLARIPNLLTMIALIHRVFVHLPHGRALLYDKIAEAYLESIDRMRGIQELAHGLEDKRRWLARVGFEMQERRGPDKNRREILADGAEVKAWIETAMAESGFGAEAETAAAFLDYVGRRSGLLLPRGEGRYAFTHLSFQEYFAAVYLNEELTGPPSLADKGRDRVRTLAADPAWQEVLIFLAEMLASKRGWPADLAALLFGPEAELLAPLDDAATNRAILAARLAFDPHAGFPPALRDCLVEACCRHELARQNEGSDYIWRQAELRRVLWGADPAGMVARLIRLAEETEARRLVLSGGGAGLADLAPLAGLGKLRILDLSGTAVTDLAPLAGLTNLQTLDLSGTAVTDLAPLAGLGNLRELYLANTAVTDLSPLAGLTNLQILYLAGTAVTDLAPLAGLGKLEVLALYGTAVTDLAPLAGLGNLGYLYLSDTKVPASEIAKLEKALPKLGILR